MRNTKKIMNIMLDLETLGKKPGCKIVAIGAYSFEDYLGAAELYTVINRHSQDKLTEDPETVKWWSEQDKQLQQEIFENIQAVEIQEALLEFAEFISLLREFETPVRIWGNSAAFDISILKAAFEAYGIEVPWTYKEEMCYRTLKNLFPQWKDPEFKGTKHHPLDDAKHQAFIAYTILDSLSTACNDWGINFQGFELYE